MAIVTMKEMIDVGVHYGTPTRLWNPRMKPYIYGERNKVYVIDLKETAKSLVNAYYFLQKLGQQNKNILFVGTKRQAREVIRETARELNQPYVSERWLGGMLTNINTVRQSIRRLDFIEEEMANPEYNRQSKKAQARYARERRRILRNLEGVRDMTKVPDALVVIDSKKEETAIREARILGIPVIALSDTDCDPDTVNLPIPGNDDGIRSIQLVLRVLSDGYKAGRAKQTKAADKTEEAPKAEAPAAEEAKA